MRTYILYLLPAVLASPKFSCLILTEYLLLVNIPPPRHPQNCTVPSSCCTAQHPVVVYQISHLFPVPSPTSSSFFSPCLFTDRQALLSCWPRLACKPALYPWPRCRGSPSTFVAHANQKPGLPWPFKYKLTHVSFSVPTLRAYLPSAY